MFAWLYHCTLTSISPFLESAIEWMPWTEAEEMLDSSCPQDFTLGFLSDYQVSYGSKEVTLTACLSSSLLLSFSSYSLCLHEFEFHCVWTQTFHCMPVAVRRQLCESVFSIQHIFWQLNSALCTKHIYWLGLLAGRSPTILKYLFLPFLPALWSSTLIQLQMRLVYNYVFWNNLVLIVWVACAVRRISHLVSRMR